MAGSIRTNPVTREYEDGWERTFRGALHHESSEEIEDAVSGETDADEASEDVDREPAEKPTAPAGARYNPCAACGRDFERPDQSCACADRATEMHAACEGCGAPVTAPGARRCVSCEHRRFHRA